MNTYDQLIGAGLGSAGAFNTYAPASTYREPKIGDKVLTNKHKEGVIMALSWSKSGYINMVKVKFSGFFYGSGWVDNSYISYLEPK